MRILHFLNNGIYDIKKLKYKLISYYYPAKKKKKTHPNAKTSDSLEKGSLSSSVSEESCWMSSGAR